MPADPFAWLWHCMCIISSCSGTGFGGQAMCGIAGMVDLAGRRPVPVRSLQDMAAALVHRGPDEDGFLVRPGVGLASRRLSIVGLRDGRQPIANETGDVRV